jgi:hypothetical protein
MNNHKSRFETIFLHLHYGGKVFDLDVKQWKLSTKSVIQECHVRLESAQTLPLMVDSVAMIGDAVAALPVANRPVKAKLKLGRTLACSSFGGSAVWP